MTSDAPSKHVSRKRAICFLVISGVFYAIIPFTFLYIGCTNIKKCPEMTFLPIWLIVVAILIIMDKVMFWRISINEITFEKEFPKPEIEEFELLKTWEINRMRSTSKILILAKTSMRIVYFFAIIFGTYWSYDLFFKHDLVCRLRVFVTVFCFCFINLIYYLVLVCSFLHNCCVSCSEKLDQEAKRNLGHIL